MLQSLLALSSFRFLMDSVPELTGCVSFGCFINSTPRKVEAAGDVAPTLGFQHRVPAGQGWAEVAVEHGPLLPPPSYIGVYDPVSPHQLPSCP